MNHVRMFIQFIHLLAAVVDPFPMESTAHILGDDRLEFELNRFCRGARVCCDIGRNSTNGVFSSDMQYRYQVLTVSQNHMVFPNMLRFRDCFAGPW